MTTFIYRCPVTGYNVQGIVSGDQRDKEPDSHFTVTCTICGRHHLIDTETLQVPPTSRKQG